MSPCNVQLIESKRRSLRTQRTHVTNCVTEFELSAPLTFCMYGENRTKTSVTLLGFTCDLITSSKHCQLALWDSLTSEHRQVFFHTSILCSCLSPLPQCDTDAVMWCDTADVVWHCTLRVTLMRFDTKLCVTLMPVRARCDSTRRWSITTWPCPEPQLLTGHALAQYQRLRLRSAWGDFAQNMWNTRASPVILCGMSKTDLKGDAHEVGERRWIFPRVKKYKGLAR